MKVVYPPLNSRTLLVGCGKMGSALAEGWLKRGLNPENLLVVEPHQKAAVRAKEKGISVVNSFGAVDRNFDPNWIVFAVKPKDIEQASVDYKHFKSTANYLSIAAGISLSTLKLTLGADARIVRGMPNMPAAVGRGITALLASENLDSSAREECTLMLEVVGEVVWLEDERMMDTVTGVSGSGPAYAFLLIECLAEAGKKMGLSSELSGKLARSTVCGAGALAWLSDEDAATLRENVTSPGGTTAAAMDVLMDPDKGLQAILDRAVAAAVHRSRKLNDE